MLDLIEPLLDKRKLDFVRLDGSIPQKKRQALVSQFQSDEKIRVFLTTNAGSTGLNLQAANTVINVDLPWNPAVLEQRIARAHRMGQTQPVCVFVLVTEQTLEENLLTTLSSKRELAMAALDPESRVAEVDVRTQSDDIKEKLEVLLGAKPEAPLDETVKETASLAAVNDRLATAGSALVRAAFDILGEIVGGHGSTSNAAIEENVRAMFDAKIVADEAGRRRLSLAMPSRDTLATLMRGLAGMLAGGREQEQQRVEPHGFASNADTRQQYLGRETTNGSCGGCDDDLVEGIDDTSSGQQQNWPSFVRGRERGG